VIYYIKKLKNCHLIGISQTRKYTILYLYTIFLFFSSFKCKKSSFFICGADGNQECLKKFAEHKKSAILT